MPERTISSMKQDRSWRLRRRRRTSTTPSMLLVLGVALCSICLVQGGHVRPHEDGTTVENGRDSHGGIDEEIIITDGPGFIPVDEEVSEYTKPPIDESIVVGLMPPEPIITISPAPTKSATPSSNPTLSAVPTLSISPSGIPTSSPSPTTTASPTDFVKPPLYLTATGEGPHLSVTGLRPEFPTSSPAPSQTAYPTHFPSQSPRPTETGMPTSRRDILEDNFNNMDGINLLEGVLPEEPTASPAPTVTAEPTGFPSQSPAPTVTGEPTSVVIELDQFLLEPFGTDEPTITATPTFTATPTYAPSQSPYPTITGEPTTMFDQFAGLDDDFDGSDDFVTTEAPTITAGPTVTAEPTALPSHSPSPTITGEPTEFFDVFDDVILVTGGTGEPTITAGPSVSGVPSMEPSQSPGPTVTGMPTALEAIEPGPCYSDWNTLVADVAELGGGVYTICSNSVFDLTEDDISGPLVVSANNTLIACGEDGSSTNQCLIFGGDQQIVISGSPTEVFFQGLTLVGSTDKGVDAAGGPLADALFLDCEFSGHTGLAAVFVYDSGTQTFPAIPEEGSMTLMFSACVFSDNDVTYGALTSLGGNVTVVDSMFNGNTAENGAIAVWFGGDISVSLSCFMNNTGTSFGSTIFLTLESNLVDNLLNFGEDNEVGKGDCLGVALEGDECFELESEVCLSSTLPTEAPTPAPTHGFECLDLWEDLAEAIFFASADDMGGSFAICPDTTFNFTDYDEELTTAPPLLLSSSNITLQCGEDGSRANQCIFMGGVSHILLQGNITGVVIQGITMREATEVSVEAVLMEPFSIQFLDCLWEENTGNSTVLVAIEDDVVEGAGGLSTFEPQSGSPTPAPIPDMPTYIIGGIDDDILNDGFLVRNDEDENHPTPAPIIAKPTYNRGFDKRDLEEETPSAEGFLFQKCSFKQNVVADAVVVNIGAEVVVALCEFTDNVAVDGTVIFTERGSSDVTSSCFEGNKQSALQGLVFGDDESFLNFEDNFGANNTGSSSGSGSDGCDGFFEQSSGVCSLFDSDVCSVLIIPDCLSTWKDLYEAVREARIRGVGGSFTLCENTNFDLTGLESLLPIKVGFENTLIQCGTSGLSNGNCTISGGSVQFEIMGSPTGVEFRGLTMSGSTVAAVNAAGFRSARASFIDCVFTDHTGLAVILNYNGTITSERRRGLNGHRRNAELDLPRPVDRSMNVEVEFCHFSNNDVKYAPLANLGGTCLVADTQFENNSGESGGVGIWYEGGAAILNSCFVGNVGEKSGAAFFSEDSALADDEENFSSENVGENDDQCTDLFLAGGCQAEGLCQGLCVTFNAPNCTARDAPTEAPSMMPSSAPSILPPDCYSEWTQLSLAVQSAAVNVFTLCPNSTFDLDGSSPILIEDGDIEIRCGDNGSFENDCQITGGTVHFDISNPQGAVEFVGIKMTGASLVSVLASGTSSSGVVTFLRCEWMRNLGQAIVLAYNGGTFQAGDDIGLLQSDDSMKLDFQSCHFEENDASFAVVALVGGEAEFRQSSFINNVVDVGVISAASGANVDIANSCFVNNSGRISGTIFADADSFITFGGYFSAESKGDECDGYFKEDDTICLSTQICEGTCNTDTDATCNVEGIDYSVPTAAPVPIPPAPTSMQPIVAIQVDDLEEEPFTSSFAFATVLIVGLVVVLAGVVSFVVCNKQRNGEPSEVPVNDSMLDENDIQPVMGGNKGELRPLREEDEDSMESSEEDSQDYEVESDFPDLPEMH